MDYSKSRIQYGVKLGLTAAALGLLGCVAGWGEIGDALSNTAPLWLLCMYIGSFCRRWIEAFQMHTLLGWVGSTVPTGRVFFANTLSALYALIVPGDLAAAGAKWANLSAAAGNKAVILNAIVYNRVATVLPPLLAGAAAFALDDPFREPMLRAVIIGFLLVLVGGGMFLYHPRLGPLTDRVLLRGVRVLPGFVVRRVDKVIASLDAFRAMAPLRHLAILTMSVASTLVRVVIFILASYAAGARVPVLTLVWMLALLNTVRMAPITISNIGVREGLLIAILGRYNTSAETAVALGLVLFSNHLLFAVVGGGYQLALSLGWANWTNRSTRKTGDIEENCS